MNPELVALIFRSVFNVKYFKLLQPLEEIFTSKCSKAEITQFCSMFLLMQHNLPWGFQGFSLFLNT